jgi:Asp-tRNA(Asn)/Glu-tRNA(Gln) amidotransferase A subunit family amidase
MARLLDAMVGYDPEDPITALGVGKEPRSYAALLEKHALKGARIGILRESIGGNSDPASDDFKKVDAVFGRNVAELKAAGAVLVDPIEIPDITKLLAVRGTDDAAADQALQLYLARTPDSPLKTRDDIAKAPDLTKSIPPSKAAQWTTPRRPPDLAQWARYVQARDQLMVNIAKAMADNKLDAIVYKTIEHQPGLIRDAINPPYSGARGVPMLNTFLVYAAAMTVPAGFTSDNLPTGLTFFGPPYSEPTLIKLAYGFEQATHHRRPPKTTPPLGAAILF